MSDWRSEIFDQKLERVFEFLHAQGITEDHPEFEERLAEALSDDRLIGYYDRLRDRLGDFAEEIRDAWNDLRQYDLKAEDPDKGLAQWEHDSLFPMIDALLDPEGPFSPEEIRSLILQECGKLIRHGDFGNDVTTLTAFRDGRISHMTMEYIAAQKLEHDLLEYVNSLDDDD